MNTIAVIDYGSGNLRSVAKAFERAASSENCKVLVTSNPDDLSDASHIVLPGVGAFRDCMNGLASISGMIAKLENEVLKRQKPFLGICVGMQLLADYSMEHGKCSGLGWIGGEVKLLEPDDRTLKVPHMGWNNLEITQNGILFEGLSASPDFYFTHSYYLETDTSNICAVADYGVKVTSAVAKGNIYGTQFHPEKSQKNGLMLIKNFITGVKC